MWREKKNFVHIKMFVCIIGSFLLGGDQFSMLDC